MKHLNEIVNKVRCGKQLSADEAKALILELERLHRIVKNLETDLEVLSEEMVFLNDFY